MSASPIGAKAGSTFVAGSFRGLAGKSDKRLVELAQRGDGQAVEALYDRYATAILRYCRSLLRSAQEAEDVQQEVFVQALSALRDGAGPDSFRPWLYRVAHNACVSHMRAKRPTLTAVDGDFAAAATTVQPASDEREELRQLLDDLSALPEVQRGALLLREMDGFSYEQVGQVLGLPVTTVRSTIFRARSTLQGLAEARDAKCAEIQAELSRLADRRGRRSRQITSHLKVCGDCRDFRDGLRERQTILRGFTPVLPLGALGAESLTAEGIAGAGAAVGASSGFGLLGIGGAGKLIAAAASTCALVGGAGTQIGVLGGGSGAAVDAETSTVAAEPDARTVAHTPGAPPAPGSAAGAALRDAAGAAYGAPTVSYAAPGTVTWRPAGGGNGVETGRDGQRVALSHGHTQTGRAHTSSAPGHHQWGYAAPGPQFHSLAASESGFLLTDDGGPAVQRYDNDRSGDREDAGSSGNPQTDAASDSSGRTTSGSGDSRDGEQSGRQEPREGGTSQPGAGPAPTETKASPRPSEPTPATTDSGTYTPPPSDAAAAPAPAPTPGPGEPSSTQVEPAPTGATTTSEPAPAPQDPAAPAP